VPELLLLTSYRDDPTPLPTFEQRVAPTYHAIELTALNERREQRTNGTVEARCRDERITGAH